MDSGFHFVHRADAVVHLHGRADGLLPRIRVELLPKDIFEAGLERRVLGFELGDVHFVGGPVGGDAALSLVRGVDADGEGPQPEESAGLSSSFAHGVCQPSLSFLWLPCFESGGQGPVPVVLLGKGFVERPRSEGGAGQPGRSVSDVPVDDGLVVEFWISSAAIGAASDGDGFREIVGVSACPQFVHALPTDRALTIGWGEQLVQQLGCCGKPPLLSSFAVNDRVSRILTLCHPYLPVRDGVAGAGFEPALPDHESGVVTELHYPASIRHRC